MFLGLIVHAKRLFQRRRCGLVGAEKPARQSPCVVHASFDQQRFEYGLAVASRKQIVAVLLEAGENLVLCEIGSWLRGKEIEYFLKNNLYKITMINRVVQICKLTPFVEGAPATQPCGAERIERILVLAPHDRVLPVAGCPERSQVRAHLGYVFRMCDLCLM